VLLWACLLHPIRSLRVLVLLLAVAMIQQHT